MNLSKRFKVYINSELANTFDTEQECHVFVYTYMKSKSIDEVCIANTKLNEYMFTYVFYGKTRKRMFTIIFVDSLFLSMMS